MSIEPRKQGRQSRAKVTEASIVEAAARILEREGFDAITTNHIAQAAGVSIGSLYQYFPNKGAVLAALVRRERADLLGEVKRIADAPDHPDEAIAALIDAALAHQFARPRLALHLEHVEQTLDLGDEADDLARDLSRTISGIVRQRSPEAGSHVAQDIVAMTKGIINAAAMSGESDLPGLRRRILLAANGYLDAMAGDR